MDVAPVLVAVAPGLVVVLAALALVVPELVVTTLEVPALVVPALVVPALVVVLPAVVVTALAFAVVVVVDGPGVVVVVSKKPRSCSLQVALEHHCMGSPSPISPKCSCMAKFDESRMVNQKT